MVRHPLCLNNRDIRVSYPRFIYNLRSKLRKRIERLRLKKQQAPHLEPGGTASIFYPRFIKNPWHRAPSTLFKQPGYSG
jgi:hypothetical protein